MRKKTSVFPSGNPLPQNVYHAPKPADRNLHYRYKKPCGGFVKLNMTDESEIIRVAQEANEVLSENKYINTTENKSYKKGTIGFWLKKYQEQRTEALPNKKITKYHRDVFYTMWHHMKPILNTSTFKVTRKDFKLVWDGMSGHTQNGRRSVLREFVELLIDEELLNDIRRSENPFLSVPAGGFKTKPKEAKKRSIMRFDVFVDVKRIAEKKGMHFLVDALEIGFLTYLRLSDILNLTFQGNGIPEGKLTTVIGKSEGRAKAKAVVHEYDLKKHTTLKKVIARAQLRLDASSECPYIIHHAFKIYKKNPVEKNHPNQVTVRYLGDCLNSCLSEMDEYRDVPLPYRPSFHELRALRLHVDKSTRDINEISLDMAHKDTKITLSNYDTHDQYDTHSVEYVPSLSIVN